MCRVPFPPCAGFFFHPVQDSFATLCRVLFPPCAGFSLCRVLFLPCAGSFSLCRVFFYPVQGSFFFHTVQEIFLTLCRVRFPPCAGFPFHPAQASFPPSGPAMGHHSARSHRALFLFHTVQDSFSIFLPCHTWALSNPPQGFFHPVQDSFSALST